MPDEIQKPVVCQHAGTPSHEFVSVPMSGPSASSCHQQTAWVAHQQSCTNLFSGIHNPNFSGSYPSQQNFMQKMWYFFMAWLVQGAKPSAQEPVAPPEIPEPPPPICIVEPIEPPTPPAAPEPVAPAPPSVPLQTLVDQAGSMLRDIRTDLARTGLEVITTVRDIDQYVYSTEQLDNIQNGISERIRSAEQKRDEINEFLQLYPDSVELQNLRNEVQSRIEAMQRSYTQFTTTRALKGR